MYRACHDPTKGKFCVLNSDGAEVFPIIPDFNTAKDLAAVLNLGREMRLNDPLESTPQQEGQQG